MGKLVQLKLTSLLFVCLQPREKGRMRFHRLQNVQIALDFLKQRQVRVSRVFPILPGNVGIGSLDVLSAPGKVLSKSDRCRSEPCLLVSSCIVFGQILWCSLHRVCGLSEGESLREEHDMKG